MSTPPLIPKMISNSYPLITKKISTKKSTHTKSTYGHNTICQLQSLHLASLSRNPKIIMRLQILRAELCPVDV